MTPHARISKLTQMPPRTIWWASIIISIAVHVSTSGGLSFFVHPDSKIVFTPVKVKVAQQVVTETKPSPPPPPKKERPKKQTLAPNAKLKPTAQPQVAPVQGLSKDSLSTTGTMAAPVGNTLMMEDDGKRFQAVDQLQGDQSAPAKLITATLITPPYSEEAIDAAIEGTFVVDVFVNVDGSVREAELRKKIGYGMDERVIAAVKKSEFKPRKNKLGVTEEGWAELKFTLLIP